MNVLYDKKGDRKYLTRAERTLFLNSAKEMADTTYTFCATLAYTGARISEVLALTPRSFDFAEKIVVIETLKKRERGVFRTIPLPSAFLETLDGVHNLRSAELSQDRLWPWSRTTGWKRVKKVMGEAGLEGTKATAKGLRHSFGVNAVQSRAPITAIQKWLGHSHVSTTAIYTDVMGEEERHIAKLFWATFD